MSVYSTQTDDGVDGRKVSVVVPTYNERENVVPMVRSILSAMSGRETEVIVVDDDSPDETWRLAQSAYADRESVRVVHRTADRGLSSAVVRGYREATNGTIAVIDADFQHPPERLPDLVDALVENDVDVAVGTRYLFESGIDGWSYRRRIVSHGATAMARVLVPEAAPLSDPLSGFFALRRDVVDGVTLDPTGYKILLEVLTECDVDRVAEVPYTFSDRDRGESKATAEEYARFVNHLASCWYRTRLRDDGAARAATPLLTRFRR